MTRVLAYTVFLLTLVAWPASAQELPRWDAAATAGLFLSNPPAPSDATTYDDWGHSASLHLTAGRYFGPHLKAEVEALFAGESTRYFNRIVFLPNGVPFSTGGRQLSHLRGIGGGLAWQFFENEWVHPFVIAGAELDVHDSELRVYTPYQPPDPRSPTAPPLREAVENPAAVQRLAGFAGVGAKLYLTPRVFVRTEARTAVGGASHVSLRIGAGVDF